MATNNPTGQNGAGGANGGSQYSPFNVSATGGAGQSGGMDMQAATYVPGLPYGEGQQNYDNQVAAPMAGNPVPQMEMPTPLMAPTARPNEPITAGINSGPGGGTELMRDLPNTVPNVMDTLKTIMQFDTSGDVELLYRTLTDNGYGA